MLTTTKAAERLKVTRNRVCKLARDGRIASVRYGRDYLVTEEEVERYGRERRLRGRPRKERS